MSEKGGRASEHHEHVERRTLKSRAPFQQRTKQKERKKPPKQKYARYPPTR
jgi:hypothetical protein